MSEEAYESAIVDEACLFSEPCSFQPMCVNERALTRPFTSGNSNTGKSTLLSRLASRSGEQNRAGQDTHDLGLSYDVLDIHDESDEGGHCSDSPLETS